MNVRLSVPIFVCGALSACANDPTHVIASTATVIGVDLGQGQATQTVTGTLGYKRAEFALVPTNKTKSASGGGASADTAGSNSGGGAVGGGATDVADVVMELNYQGIFSGNGGIYQRLAVGRNAVMGGAAKTLFAKDPDGTVSAGAAKIASEEAISMKEKVDAIAKCFDSNGNVNAGVRDPVVTQATAANASQFHSSGINLLKQQTTTVALTDFLLDLGDGMVPGLFDALPDSCG